MTMAIAGLVCGLIFGIGLVISGMTQPSKVLGFLDVFGVWDPTLAFVMAGALIVSSAGFALARRRNAPVFAVQVAVPAQTLIDRPLVGGAVLFGIGWGLVGLCPGPALVNLASSLPPVILFVAAMAAGIALHDVWWRRRPAQSQPDRGSLASADG